MIQTIYKVSTQEINCGNCSRSISEKQKFIEGWICTTTPSAGKRETLMNQKERVTILNAITKLFNPNLQTPELIVGDAIKLCIGCGERLRDLYLQYNLFLQLNVLNSEISQLINLGKSRLAFPLPRTEPTNCQMLGNSEDQLKSDVGESLPMQIDAAFSPIQFKLEYEDTVPFTPDDTYDDAEVESPSNEETIKTEFEENTILKRNNNRRKQSFSILPTSTTTTTVPENFPQNPPVEDSGQGILRKNPVNQHGSKQCAVCDKMFQSTIYLRIHLKNAHSIDTGVEETGTYQCKRNPKTYPCPKCPRLFPKTYLQTHINAVHLKLKPYKCDLCDTSCSTAGSLKSHKTFIHLNPKEKSYLCTLCGKDFTSQGGWKYHMEKHVAKSKLFRCVICGKDFGDATALKNHKRLHTNERNHLCDICGKGFKTRNYLTTHEAHHRAVVERSKKCPYCSRGFPNRQSLKDHLISNAHGMSLEEARKIAGLESRRIQVVETL